MRHRVPGTARPHGEAVEHDRDEPLGASFRQRLLPQKAEQRPDVLGVEIIAQLTRPRSGVEQRLQGLSTRGRHRSATARRVAAASTTRETPRLTRP